MNFYRWSRITSKSGLIVRLSRGFSDVQPTGKQESSLAKSGDSNSDLSLKYTYYNKEIVMKLNDPKFVALIQKAEEREKRRVSFKVENFWVFVGVAAFGLLGFYFWRALPYTVVFKHWTFSEHTLRGRNLHSSLFSLFSFLSPLKMLIYFPNLLLAMYVVGRHLPRRWFLAGLVLNALAALPAAYWEDKILHKQKLMFPKTLGPATTTFLSAAALCLEPRLAMLGMRFLPYALVPLALLAFELRQCFMAHTGQLQLSKDTSSAAHLASAVFGIAFGLLYRRRL